MKEGDAGHQSRINLPIFVCVSKRTTHTQKSVNNILDETLTRSNASTSFVNRYSTDEATNWHKYRFGLICKQQISNMENWRAYEEMQQLADEINKLKLRKGIQFSNKNNLFLISRRNYVFFSHNL